MNTWELGNALSACIEGEIHAHLGIQTNWVGNPATSVFGIEIKLTWDNNLIKSTIVDFIGKTID